MNPLLELLLELHYLELAHKTVSGPLTLALLEMHTWNYLPTPQKESHIEILMTVLSYIALLVIYPIEPDLDLSVLLLNLVVKKLGLPSVLEIVVPCSIDAAQ